jgi:predicted CXXCH cytochrome family protein
MQCHLEPTSSPLPFRIRRYEQAPFAYVPGQPLSEHFIYFDHAPGSGHDDKFEIASAAYRLRKSQCFLRSQMTCTTCHDPHDIPRGEAAVKHYAAVCQNCHTDVHRGGVPRVDGVRGAQTCIACHMPQRRTEDAVHVVMTDHFIQRRPALNQVQPRAEVDPSQSAYHGEVVPYYPPSLPAGSNNELYVALAQVVEGSNLAEGIPRLEGLVVKYQPARPEFYYELARAYARVSNDAADVRWCEEASRRDPAFAPALAELAAAATRMRHFDKAVDALEKVTKLQPRNTVALADLGNVYLQQGRVDEARRVLEQALASDPAMPRANNTMGLASLKAGDGVRAEWFFRAAIRDQPDLAEAQNNLGNVLAGRGAYKEAAFHFQKAIESDPRYTEAHHSYGVVLALLRSYPDAMKELRIALQLDPRLSQAHLDLGDVLSSMGRRDEAAREYETALQSADPEVQRSAMAGLNGLKDPSRAR